MISTRSLQKSSARPSRSTPASGLACWNLPTCLAYELRQGGLKVLAEVAMPVVYEAVRLDVGYRLDLIVEDAVIVELKAVEKLTSIHQAQLLSYLKLSGLKIGLLFNFNVTSLKDQGICRLAN